ncbi:glycoside hydrolase family 3 N-terminal domain-containing protein [Pseudonocardia sp. TRM90224]|uniref:glycoside hydrolase family 3 N-terminal domain-containing protein n=1 Tax=Pseudonocardia sp. TRM90224 TaxID=2812678 RepID=UPI001E3A92D1|nr:glycoside hydrolase family 3 N-terminal domain-containing protein [Pseudonocardia sp. TRM90224]
MRSPSMARRARRAAAGQLLAGLTAGALLAAPGGMAQAAPPPAPPSDRLPACAAVVAEMTPRARLAQRLMVGVDAADPATTADTVHSTQVGGIFIGGNATQLLQNQALRGVQAMSRVPLAIAVDDEGGRVQRIDTLDGNLPSARSMAATLTPEQVREKGKERGLALAARGITMNLAPTVDVGEQPANSVIGDRSFGTDPDRVAEYAGAFALGLREAGIATVLKHFPGHGRATGDSHKGRVSTPPLDELRGDDLKPYTTLLGPGGALAPGSGSPATGVMVGHLDVPGLTTDLPSSLSPPVYELLRRDYGFDGLVMTDDLGAMKAITSAFSVPEAVQQALVAGADMALWSAGGRVTPVLEQIDEALAAGKIDPAANDKAVERILAAKGTCARR